MDNEQVLIYRYFLLKFIKYRCPDEIFDDYYGKLF